MSWTLYNFPLHCIVAYEVHIYIVERKRDERKNIEGKKNLGENERKLI